VKIPWKWAICPDPLIYSNQEIVKICMYTRVKYLELNYNYTAEKTEKEIIEIKNFFKNAGINFYSFHLPFTQEDDIACFYETIRNKAVKRLTYDMEKASMLGCKVVILHPTTNHFDVHTEGFNRYLLQMEKSLKELIPVAEKLKLIIAIENMPKVTAGERFGSMIEHFQIFSKTFGCRHFGFCLDTGHANISYGREGPTKFFEAMKKHIVSFHIQDNPGDRDLHIQPGKGLVNWKSFFNKLSRSNLSFPLTIEALPFAHADCYKYSFEAWENMIKEINSIVLESLKSEIEINHKIG